MGHFGASQCEASLPVPRSRVKRLTGYTIAPPVFAPPPGAERADRLVSIKVSSCARAMRAWLPSKR